MSLVKKFATVASGTLMSRVLGFAREMLMAAALGTGPVAGAFYAAFQFPNTFRRLFAEGAFNAAFVPLFAKEIEANGADGARRFSEEVFGVLFSVLTVLTILMELSMPLIVATVVAPGYTDDPAKFDLTASLATIMFPYLICMSLGAMMAGMLNSLRRYFAAAVAPVFLNIILVGVLIYAWYAGADDIAIGYWLAGCAGGGDRATRHRWIAVRARRRVDRLPPAAADAERQAAAVARGACGHHRRHHRDQHADRYGIASGQDKAVPALAQADRFYQLPLGVVGVAVGDRAPAGTGAGAEGRQSDRSLEHSEPLGRVHAVPDAAGRGRAAHNVGADRARALRARRLHAG